MMLNLFLLSVQGTFLSIFNEDTELGKKYVFDIQKTCREVHDHARRYLHKNGISPAGPATLLLSHPELIDGRADSCVDQQRIQAEVNKQIAEVICCKICMDNTIDASFVSCGHVVSCMECAKK